MIGARAITRALFPGTEPVLVSRQLRLKAIHILLGNLQLTIHHLLPQPRAHDFAAHLVTKLREAESVFFDGLAHLRQAHIVALG